MRESVLTRDADDAVRLGSGLLRRGESGEAFRERVRTETWTASESGLLAPAVAANVTVQPLPDDAVDQLCVRRLSGLAAGQRAIVASISPACRGVERRRLLDLGLVPGTEVSAEFASPAGDPVAYRVRGALIALRNQQADMICIEP